MREDFGRSRIRLVAGFEVVVGGPHSIPPGVHVQATYSPAGLGARQIRILGDDRRGYLIAGLSDLEDGEDFWFRTLDEALARGERSGVTRDAWTEITSVDQAQTR